MQKDTKIALLFCGAIVGLLVLSFVLRSSKSATGATSDSSAVSVQNGVQIIDLMAKGGFSPSFVEARAGVPTEIHVSTNGTYDCSSMLVIPALGYRKTLQPTGTETITVNASEAQGTLEGTCGMGMYDFEIAFK